LEERIAQGPVPQSPPLLAVSLNGSRFSQGQSMVAGVAMTPGGVPAPVDAYVVLQGPDGSFRSLQLGGALIPGIVPIARGFAPFAYQGPLYSQVITPADAPGAYRWYAVLTVPGTLQFLSPLSQMSFSIP
jgi:hypothetical protein